VGFPDRKNHRRKAANAWRGLSFKAGFGDCNRARSSAADTRFRPHEGVYPLNNNAAGIPYEFTFDTIEVGQTSSSPGRTITEMDIHLYMMLTGGWHPVHCDKEFM
jgi:hypothetical protein